MTVQYLYKYGRLNDYSEALFSIPTIWFPTSAQLNDPFECRPCITFNNGSQEQIIERLARGLRKQNPELTNENAIAHAVSIFLEGRHRDPKTWAQLRKELGDWLGRIGLYCLSGNNDSILMWSHYADHHRGYCLQFEATDWTPVFGGALPIQYVSGLPIVDAFNMSEDEQVKLVFLTKYLGWSYEEEWRIIDHKKPGMHTYPAELLKGVIFGLRMPTGERDRIRAWVQKRGHPVKFFETIQNKRQFAIEVREIE